MTGTPTVAIQSAPRSRFVNGLAWTFIVLAGMATVSATMWNIILAIVLPLPEVAQALRDLASTEGMPGFAKFILEHIRLFYAVFLVVAVSTLAVSIELLRRKNWARIVFIVLMALAVVSNLAGIAVPFVVTLDSIPAPALAPEEFRESFAGLYKTMMVASVVFGVIFAAAHAWIIVKLVSPEIKREFVPS